MVRKQDVARAIADRTSLTIPQASEALTAFIEIVELAVKFDEEITMPNFGTLAPRIEAARVMRNPATGDRIVVPRRKTIGFRMSRTLRNRLNAADK